MASKSGGNVLFLILIAVALFAALSYAVTQSSRGGGGKPEKEKATPNASVVLNYVTSLRTAMTRLRLTGQCNSNMISFEPPPFSNSGMYYNANAPADKHCHVFHPAGGGVTPLSGFDPAYTAGLGINSLPLNFVAIVPIASLDICKDLNRAANYNPPNFTPTTPPYYSQYTPFEGTAFGGAGIPIDTPSDSGCVTGVGGGTPNLYYFSSGPVTFYWFFATIGPV